MGTAGITGVLLLTAFFLGAADQPDPDYMTEVKTECHFTNGTERVRFLYRDFYNKEEFVYFDSDIGKFIAKTELGKLDADTLNQQEDTLNYYKSQVPTVCVPNYDIWHSVTADRREPDASDSAKSKMVTGIVGFVLGGIFIAVGLVLYLKSRKAALRVPTNEHFIPQ
uniref:MHC class II beta chain N-terminal domain-containing protein n=1 Tax=Leptobrachium leishanense TaxID=445787 RepID=A0A8C5QAH2_9ANUR